MNNHRPVSLLTTCGKDLEKTIFDRIFQHLMENNLLNPNQSSFRPCNSRIHQLISITHQIYVFFASNPSLEISFLGTSKGFDWVWHEGLLYKTKCMGVKSDHLTLINFFLFERQQKSCSEWTRIWRSNLVCLRVQLFGPLFF